MLHTYSVDFDYVAKMKLSDKRFTSIIYNCLDEFRTAREFCDVILIADEKEFPAHKVILSAASPYFRAMFNTESPFVESHQEKVKLHGIDGGVLSNVLTFIYSSDIEINDDNVLGLMEATSLFQISSLKALINSYLEYFLTIKNCLQFYSMANLHDYHDLSIKLFHYILINFSKIAEKDDFLNIDAELLLKIVSSKLLDVPNEETLYEIVMKWIQKDTALRAQYLDELLSNMNLHTFSLPLLNKIKTNPDINVMLIQQIENIIHLKSSNESLAYIINNEERYNVHKFRHKIEKTVIFAIGGESSGMAQQSVECYTLGFDKWKCVVPEYIIKRQETKHTKVLPPLRCARYYAASAYDQCCVYVIGGINSTSILDECEVFSIKTNQWNYSVKFPEKMYAGGAAFLEGKLMVVGGVNEEGPSEKVWKLDNNKKNWITMPSLDCPRYFHCTVSLGGHLYVLGGFSTEKQLAQSSCLKFDPNNNKWHKICEMHEPRAKFGCAAVKQFIYVFGGIGIKPLLPGLDFKRAVLNSVERYDTLADRWHYVTSMTNPRHSFSVAVSDDEIYCLGGSDAIHFLDAVEMFSLRTDRWHCVHSMQMSRFGPAAAAFKVPYFSGDR